MKTLSFETESKHYVPTPTEIAEECRRIRSEWSPREFYLRAGMIPPEAAPPAIHRAPDPERFLAVR